MPKDSMADTVVEDTPDPGDEQAVIRSKIKSGELKAMLSPQRGMIVLVDPSRPDRARYVRNSDGEWALFGTTLFDGGPRPGFETTKNLPGDARSIDSRSGGRVGEVVPRGYGARTDGGIFEPPEMEGVGPIEEVTHAWPSRRIDAMVDPVSWAGKDGVHFPANGAEKPNPLRPVYDTPSGMGLMFDADGNPVLGPGYVPAPPEMLERPPEKPPTKEGVIKAFRGGK